MEFAWTVSQFVKSNAIVFTTADTTAAVGAGRLVVLAEADGVVELPFPLDVSGDKVTGKGTVFYQFILPMDQPPPVATTRPATAPAATQPAQPPLTASAAR